VTWLRPLLLLGGAAVAFATLTAAAVSEVDRHREADRALAGRLEAVAAHVVDVDDALVQHEHEAAVEAEAYRLRCEWEMVPSAMQREVTDAILLRPRDGRPVAVNLEIQE